MTRIPRTLDRRRKTRRAPQFRAGHPVGYQVFDETHTWPSDAASLGELSAAVHRAADRFRWRRHLSPATQHVNAMIDRLYANDTVTAQGVRHWIDKHLWAAAGTEPTPGWLQHAPHRPDLHQTTNTDDIDTTALAEASPRLSFSISINRRPYLDSIDRHVKHLARMGGVPWAPGRVKRSDVTTREVLHTVLTHGTGAWAVLTEKYPAKVVLAALHRDVSRGYLNYGSSISYCWLHESGSWRAVLEVDRGS